MPARNKQADRNAAKKESKRSTDEEPATADDGKQLVDVAKEWLLNACIVQLGPGIVEIILKLKDGKLDELKCTSNGKAAPALGKEKQDLLWEGKTLSEAIQYFKDHPDETRHVVVSEDGKFYENSEDDPLSFDPIANGKNGNHHLQTDDIFERFQQRLSWHNCLGLFEKDEDSKNAWLAVKSQELDFGPRPKRNKSPGVDRIKINLRTNMAVYMYALLALMTLRAVLFRSWFACLPWLALYQFASLALPLENMEMLPQLPLDKVPVFARVLVTTFCHTFLVVFFLYELVWKTYFFEKIPLVGLVVYHAYAVRPVGQ